VRFTPPPPRSRQERWIRRHPWLWGLILAGFIFLTTIFRTDIPRAWLMATVMAVFTFVFAVVMAKFVYRRTRDRLD
jgi:hypothetical protein